MQACDGWLIVRDIPESTHRDATGAYPVFACGRWTSLEDDLLELDPTLVSVGLVTDPFGDFDLSALTRAFPDRCFPFKEHFVTDLEAADASVPRHHLRNVRRALRQVEVEVVPSPGECLDDWVRLYACLVERHAIRGPADFSRESLARQLAVPGLTLFRAVLSGRTVGMTLWYRSGEVAYYHLGAYDADGYRHGAAFGIFAAALSHFRSEVRWLSLGAGAGIAANPDDGLTRFKRGWATGTRTAWFCGRIIDRGTYATLAAKFGDTAPHDGYFPAYRAPGRATIPVGDAAATVTRP